jgi:hypothetical protein
MMGSGIPISHNKAPLPKPMKVLLWCVVVRSTRDPEIEFL